MSHKGFGLLEIIIVVAVIGLFAYGGYFFWNKDVKKVDLNNNQQVEDNIKEIRQNPVELHNIKMKASEDVNKINQQTREVASSVEELIK